MRVFSIIILPWIIQAEDQTSVTRMLNNFMASSGDGCVYCGGRGLVVRNYFDGLQDDPTKTVVPATFWVNDMISPSQLYPDIDYPETPEEAAPRASVAMVIGTMLGELFTDVDSMQTDDWGWGVFYASDSNSVDARCRWLEDSNLYDCPGGTIVWGDTLIPDSGGDVHSGTGYYGNGNPNAGLGGGGTGPHLGGTELDQEQATDANGDSLLKNWDAECNYDLAGNNWQDWIDHWFENGDRHKYLDAAMCWVNNVRDLIIMQNALYMRPDADTGDGYPKPGTPAMFNWGWNEIPLDRLALSNPLNWDAVMIHLPAEVSGDLGNNDRADDLCDLCHWRLENTLDTWVDAGVLVPNFENIGYRPGSYVVFAKEFSSGDGNWYRWFFCDYWRSPSGKYEIMSYADGSNDGACFIQWGSGGATSSNSTLGSNLEVI